MFYLVMAIKKIWSYFVKFFSTSEHQHLTEVQHYKEGWSFYLILAAVATTFGCSVPVGYNIGVVNTPAEIIKAFCNQSVISRYDTHLSESQMNILWSSIVSIFIVGGCIGSVLGAVLANQMGRKGATVITSLLSLAGALCFLFCEGANSVEMLVLGRLLVGLAAGLTTSIVPMYLTELAPPTLTGSLGVACPMGVNVGVLMGQVMGLPNVLGNATQWTYLLSIFSLLVIVCLPVMLFLPESPKYLYVVRDEEEKALQELSRIRGAPLSQLQNDRSQLSEERRSPVNSMSMCGVLRDPTLTLPLVLVCAAQAGQQFSGINAVFYYSQAMLQSAGLSQSAASLGSVACGLVNVATAAGMAAVLPGAARRSWLLGSVVAAALLLTALPVVLITMSTVSWMPYVSMALVVAYVLVYGLGLGPIPYFIASEIFPVGPRPAGMAWGSLANWAGNFVIFPVGPRPAGMAWGSLANWAGNFVVGMSFPSMRLALGPSCFFVFAACTFALFLLLKLYFPETRGRTPTEVTELCSDGFRSRPLRRRVTNM